MIALRITSEGRGRKIAVPPAPARLVLGTAPTCDIVLTDAAVDAEHLELAMTPAGLRITDLQSSNGTKLNGLFISQGLAKVGDQIRIGLSLIEIAKRSGSAEAKGGAAETAAPARGSAPVAPAAPRRETAPRRPEQRTSPTREAQAAAKMVGQGNRPVARPARRKVNPIVVGVGALVVLALFAFYFVWQGEQGELTAANRAVSQAIEAWENENYDRARTEFKQVMTRWPDTAASERAKASLEQLEAGVSRNRTALARRTALDAEWRQLTFDQFQKEYEKLRVQFEGTKAFSGSTFIDSVRSRYIEEGTRRFQEVQAESAKLVKANRFNDAIMLWHEYIYIPQNIPPHIDQATAEFKLIEKRARTLTKDLLQQADELIKAEKFDEAESLLTAQMDTLRGTRHTTALRQKLGLIDVLRGGEAATPEVAEAKVTERREYLALAEEAERLEGLRRYAEAVTAWQMAADNCPDQKQAAGYRERADDLTGIAALFTNLLRQINETPERFRGIDLGRGFKANASGADQSHLVVDIRGAESRLLWQKLGQEFLLTLMVRLKLTAAEQLHLAAQAFQIGNDKVAHDAVTAALAADPGLTDRAFGVLARARGIPVPPGGFVAHRGKWMTQNEKQEAELREAIAAAAKDARSSDLRRREEGLASLRAFGKPAVNTLVDVLTDLREKTVEELLRHPAIKDQAMKMVLYKELNERRQAALALIFDTVKYPYPHPDGEAYNRVQAEVDELVGRVREVWDTPVLVIKSRNAEVEGYFIRAEQYSAELVALGHAPKVKFEELIGKVNKAINMPRFTPDGTSKGDLEWSDKVLAYNDEIDIGLDEQEANCVRTLNGYRMMMGRRAVKWSDQLLECARAHSKEMFEKKYFSHDCPLPGSEHDPHRKPGQRAKQAGYGGGVSENIAMGSTDGAATHWQWYGSSGHHRNLLGKGHVEVGVGRVDNYWTQNFGSANRAFDLPKKKQVGAGE